MGWALLQWALLYSTAVELAMAVKGMRVPERNLLEGRLLCQAVRSFGDICGGDAKGM